MSTLTKLTYEPTDDEFLFYNEEDREGRKSQDLGMQFWYTKYLASSLTLLHGYHGLHSAVKDITTCLDLFAGVGVSAKILKRYHPDLTKYLAIDYDPSALESFKLNNPWAKAVRCEDTYTYGVEILSQHKVDYVMVDFNATSYLRFTEDPRESKIHQALFTFNRPKWIALTDSALNKVHLHLENYSKRYGYEVKDAESYVQAVSKHLHETQGYGIRRAYRDAYVGMYLLERDAYTPKIQVGDLRNSTDPKRAHMSVVYP